MNINELLRPKVIAVIGASEREGLNRDTCVNLLKSGQNKHIYFINPNRDELLGRKCYASIRDIPEKVDLAILCVSKKIVPKVLEDAAAVGCRAAVVYGSGYSEEGTPEGKAFEGELTTLCKNNGIALMGPNCAGFSNFIDDVYAFGYELDRIDRKGDIAFISQSGQICLSMMDISHMKFSYIISSGNSAVVNMEDYLEFMVDDSHTRVISLYLEGIKQPGKFIEVLAKAAKKRKPIVVLKTGRSEKGKEIATAHTGSLAGSDESFNAICKKFGIIRVDDMEELLQTAMMLSVLDQLPEISTFASMSLSGGETSICADMGHLNGIEFPAFEQKTMDRLKELLPVYATPNNPLDSTSSISYDADAYAEVVKVVMDDPNIGMVLLGFTVLDNILESSAVFPIKEAIKKVRSEGGRKPMAMLSFVECTRDQEVRDFLEALHVPILPGAVYAFKILKYLKIFTDYRYDEKTLTLALPEKRTGKGEPVALSEQESKQLLKNYGVPIAEERVVASEEALLKAVSEMGYPVVLKIASADIPHKSDIGCVKLDIENEQDALGSYRAILLNAKTYKPEAIVSGVSVARMMPKGTEVIIGVKNDPQFGPMILCGLGGVFVEVFKDAQLYPVPINKSEALEMIRSLKSYKLFTGFRGQSPLDIDALAEALIKVAALAADKRDDIHELDINPLFIYPEGEGVCAVDALIVTK